MRNIPETYAPSLFYTEGSVYYAGGLYGGATHVLFTLLSQLKHVTDLDLAQQPFRSPVHNDESVLNRVLASAEHVPVKVLSPRYIGPDFLRQPPFKNW